MVFLLASVYAAVDLWRFTAQSSRPFTLQPLLPFDHMRLKANAGRKFGTRREARPKDTIDQAAAP